MDGEIVKYKLMPIMDEVYKDGDMFFYVHVEKGSDSAFGSFRNFGKDDALVLIRKMVKKFHLDPLDVMKVFELKVVDFRAEKESDDD